MSNITALITTTNQTTQLTGPSVGPEFMTTPKPNYLTKHTMPSLSMHVRDESRSALQLPRLHSALANSVEEGLVRFADSRI
jgi:hypothetical protein